VYILVNRPHIRDLIVGQFEIEEKQPDRIASGMSASGQTIDSKMSKIMRGPGVWECIAMPSIPYWLKHFDPPTCPICLGQMKFVLAKAEEPGFSQREFECLNCAYAEVDLVKLK
jgi:hypothetical protein